MIKSLDHYEKKMFSQNGEDGVVLEILYRIYGSDIFNKFYVEFGVENASQCNTRVLREYYGWSGLLMDGSHNNSNINLHKEFITKENIVDLFIKYSIPKEFNLLSIDIDLNDFYVLNKVVSCYSIDLIILEYNGGIDPNVEAVIQYSPNKTWDGSNYFGASLVSFTKMLNKYNYSLVYVENNGVNAFYVNNKFVPDTLFLDVNNINAIYKKPKYGCGPNGGHIQDCYYRKFLTTQQAMDFI
jgi:hypothetical protein